MNYVNQAEVTVDVVQDFVDKEQFWIISIVLETIVSKKGKIENTLFFIKFNLFHKEFVIFFSIQIMLN